MNTESNETQINNQSDAIRVLIKAVQIAQSKGVYNLEQASTIFKAISLFVKSNEDKDLNEQ